MNWYSMTRSIASSAVLYSTILYEAPNCYIIVVTRMCGESNPPSSSSLQNLPALSLTFQYAPTQTNYISSSSTGRQLDFIIMPRYSPLSLSLTDHTTTIRLLRLLIKHLTLPTQIITLLH
jgi:hypothetical protein